MSIQTVTGLIPDNQLGKTMIHEHIFIDLTNQFQPWEPVIKNQLSQQKVSMNNLGVLRHNPLALKDNMMLSDPEVAQSELFAYRAAGGDTLVDVTNIGLGRDIRALYAMSRLTGVQVVAGCGYYYQATHPAYVRDSTPDMLAGIMLEDLKKGIDGTPYRAGLIGELGMSPEFHPDEEKVLIAAARAQAETGAGIQVHIFPWSKPGTWPGGMDALHILQKNGAIMEKVAINHADVAFDIKPDYIEALLQTGASVTFDNFGHEFYITRENRKFIPGPFASDAQRTQVLADLIAKGYVKQLMLANDICHKNMLHTYGGDGYDHVLTNIVPMLYDFGITDEQIHTMLADNAQRFLSMPL